MLTESRPDILCITETWLRSSVPDSLLTGSTNYSIVRLDRQSDSIGGGVCILFNNLSVKAVPVCIPDKYRHLELVAIDILSASVKTRLFACYRPPSSNYDTFAVRYVYDLCESLTVLQPSDSTVIICGDLNFPSINWNGDNSMLLNDSSCTGLFLKYVYDNAMFQFVNEPTRLGNLLDIVLCNDNNAICNTKTLDTFSTSDHCMVSFSIISSPLCYNTAVTYHDFNRADWDSMRNLLFNTDFEFLCRHDIGADTKFELFYTIIYNCLCHFVPVRTVGSRSGHIKYPSFIRNKLKQKAAAWRVYKRFRIEASLLKHKNLARECRRSIYSYIVRYESRLIDSGNTGSFFRYANNKFSSKTAVGPLRATDGSLTVQPEAKAELLQQVFSSSYVFDNGSMPSSTRDAPSRCLDNILFSTNLVMRAIKKLKKLKKGGTDGIPPLFIKNCSSQLVLPLTRLFQISFENAYLPPDWLRAHVCPIYKKGPASDASNYRPIALTCIICKLMESVVKDQLLTFLLEHGLINKHQHAFMSRFSTNTNLLECTFDWFVALAHSDSVDVIYIDFSKAFDSIVYSKLLFKLSSLGISGKLLAWLAAFLHNRSQCVAIENIFSSISSVISGVPQGSVLGPVLFLVFINDIDVICHGRSRMKLFADDLKIYNIVDITNPTATLQLSLDHLVEWSAEWQLPINIKKCSVLTINRSESHKTLTASNYYLDGSPLVKSTSVMDLGIKINSDLSFQSHIGSIVSKARQRVGVLFRGFHTRQVSFLKKAYITYIRPLLEYNSNIWNPTHVYLIDLMENVQRAFTKRVKALSQLSYIERLGIFSLESLELRRLRYDLVQYYKILNNLTPLNPAVYFNLHYPPTSARDPSPLILKPIRYTNKVLSGCFFYRHIDCWNSLPSVVRTSKSLTAFKSALCNIDLSDFLRGSAFRF